MISHRTIQLLAELRSETRHLEEMLRNGQDHARSLRRIEEITNNVRESIALEATR
jgi:hypothetical protein